MAIRALPPGTVRRRTMFGLLDADGWTAAFLKALFWFLTIIVLLGYIPDRAYYATVSPTVDVGFNVASIVNLCPPGNRDLPCPAPAGAVTPWEPSPSEVMLPEARTNAAGVQSGTGLYLVGGTVGTQATASVLQTTGTTDGNTDRWIEGPALPEPRTQMSVTSLSGVPYVVGGLDAAGAPTDTVFIGAVENGVLTGWEANEEMRLPQPLSEASAVATPAGLYVFGGRGADGPLATVYRSELNEAGTALGAWQEMGQFALPEPRASAAGLLIGNYVYLVGGEGPNVATEAIYRLQVDSQGVPIESGEQQVAQTAGWATAPAGQALPAARTRATAFSSNGGIYVIGGLDASGAPTNTVYWSVPSQTTGDIPEWRILDQSNLPEPRAGAAITSLGSFAFLAGGEGESGPSQTVFRADLAPQPPFFRLGLIGATVPALSIQGEIGQQLGYINAFGIGLTNFVILILIGLAFSHRRKTREVLSRMTRGRVRPPPDETYST